jgi:hypothetical protein
VTRWMGLIRGSGLALGVWVVLAPVPAAAETSPLVGTWRWNSALSRLPAGEAVPAAVTATIARADAAHVHWTITMAAGQGQKASRSFDVPANGEAYPISSDTTAAVTLNGPGLKAVFNGPNGEIDTLSCAVADAGKRMTCTGQVQDKDKKTSSYVDVYDRI